jgi:hypothetical protein
LCSHAITTSIRASQANGGKTNILVRSTIGMCADNYSSTEASCSFCTPEFEEPNKLFFFMENRPRVLYPVKVPKKMLFDKCSANNSFEPTRCRTKVETSTNQTQPLQGNKGDKKISNLLRSQFYLKLKHSSIRPLITQDFILLFVLTNIFSRDHRSIE